MNKVIVFIITLVLMMSSSFAADRYWVGGGASTNWDATANTNWSATSGGANNASVPASGDDVYFDGNSGTSNTIISAAITIRSLNCTGYAGTITHNTAVALSIGDGTVGAGNIALKFVGTMTYILGNTVTSEIKFISSSATVQSVDFNGRTTGSVTFNGAGGSWQFTGQHNMGLATYLTLTTGTLDVNSKTVVWGLFSSSSGLARTLTMGSANITLLGGVNSDFWLTTNVTGLTVTANTATVTLIKNAGSVAPLFRSLTKDWNGMSVVFVGGRIATLRAGNSVFFNLTVNGTSTTGEDRLQVNESFTVSNSLNLLGFSGSKRLRMHSNGGSRTITIAGATVTAQYLNLYNMNFTVGTDLSGITGGAGDLGGNNNITFSVGISLFWYTTTSGTKLWSDPANWYTNTNGVSAAGRSPLPQDSAVFDLNSMGASGIIVESDTSDLGIDITWTGVTNNPVWHFTTNVNVYGSLTLDSNMSMSVVDNSRWLYMRGNGTGNTFNLTSAGLRFPHKLFIFFGSNTNTMKLLDDFQGDSSNATSVYTTGTVDLNNKNFTIGQFRQASGTITLGSGLINITGFDGGGDSNVPNAWRAAGTVNGGTSTIKFSDTTAKLKTFRGGNKTYNKLLISGSGKAVYVIQDSNTFDTIQTENTVAHSILFIAAKTTTVTNFTVNGSANNLVTIGSTTNADHILAKAGGGNVNIDYVHISNSEPTTGVWIAGANSVDGGNNNNGNWTFGADLPGLWTNTNANNSWNDTGNWAGGAVPGSSTQVYFSGKFNASCTIDTAVDVKGINVGQAFTSTLSQGANTMVIGSNGFELTGGTFTGGSQNITSTGRFSITAGTFTSTSANFQVTSQNGSTFYIDSSSTFTHNGGTVTIVGSSNAEISAPTGDRLNDLTIDTSGTISGTIFVNNDFTRSAGSGNSLDADVSVARHYLGTGGNAGGSGAIRFIGAVAQNFTNPNAPFVEINTTGSVDVPADITIGGGWTQTAGTVNWFSKKATFNNLTDANITITSGAFYDLELAKKSTNDVTLTNNSVIANNLTITSLANLNGSGAKVSGNYVVIPMTWTGTGKVIFSGTGNSTISGAGRQGVTTEINKTGGKVELTGALNIYNAGHDLTVTVGELDLKGFDVTVADTFTVNGTMSLKGNETITVNSLTTSADANAKFTISPTTSTIAYTDSTITATITKLAKTFFSLTFGASKTHEIATGGGNGITVNGTLSSNGTSGTKSIIRSIADSGTAWELTLNGTSTLADKVDVKNSDASSGTGVLATGSLGRGVNTNWVGLVDIPSIVSILATSGSGYYEKGDSVILKVTFSENVILTGGTLVIKLNSGGIVTIKAFPSSNVATGVYVVHASQNSGTLDALSFSLSAGTLKSGGSVNVDLSLPGINISSNKNISIITSSSETSSRSNGNGGGGCSYSKNSGNEGSAEWLVLFLFLLHFVLFLRRK
ncbi:MAG: hypothetical protein COA79_16450 [Planctomycetota bacterium]|nr:MAG: hypothetical protein COA79_16450 [Planctomycetota bacterium]